MLISKSDGNWRCPRCETENWIPKDDSDFGEESTYCPVCEHFVELEWTE